MRSSLNRSLISSNLSKRALSLNPLISAPPKAPPKVEKKKPKRVINDNIFTQNIERFKNSIIETNKYFTGDVDDNELRLFQSDPKHARQMWPTATFNVDLMSEFIHPDNLEKRKQVKELLSSDLFTPEYNIPIERERYLAYERLKAICDGGYLSVKDFDNNPDWVFTSPFTWKTNFGAYMFICLKN